MGPMCRPSTWLPLMPDKLKFFLHDRRSVNDRWLSDWASSSYLDIGWWGTNRRCCGDKQDERSEQVNLLGAEWLLRK